MPTILQFTYTYYGRMDYSKKPKHGVDILMLDEHIKTTFEREKAKLIKEATFLLEEFKNLFPQRFKDIEDNIQNLNKEMQYIRKQIIKNNTPFKLEDPDAGEVILENKPKIRFLKKMRDKNQKKLENSENPHV